MRLLVTGSRDWTDYEHIYRVLEGFPKDTQLVHGGARGADLLAHKAALKLGWLEPEVHKADWNSFGKRAGSLRNQAMVDLGADLCLAFPLEQSRGTWDCIQRAERADIPVIRADQIVYPPNYRMRKP